MVGTVLDDRYHLTRLIGVGGMGVVYEAVHLRTERCVAVKVIANRDETEDDDELVVRFQREAKAAGRLDTRYIGQILDAGRDPTSDRLFIVMELLAGSDLKNVVLALGPLPHELALRIAAQACMGLQHAHAADVVHCDIKPANLFLARQEGGEVIVKLLDFGVAKLPPELLRNLADTGTAASGPLLGAPRFMSPEQANGLRTLDHRLDLWSLGAVLYEAPSGAIVQVDGANADVRSGAVTISGGLDTIHQVHVIHGDEDYSVDVVITAAGPVPAQVAPPLGPAGDPSACR